MARPEQRVRVPVVLPAEGHPAAWLRNFRLSWFALAMLALIVAALLILAAPLRELVEQRQTIAQLEQSVADAHVAVDDLNEQVARWSDPAYVQAQARERLYYVLPGDHSYLVVGQVDTANGADDLPISDEIQTTQTDWVGGLLSSVYTAGLTDETPAQLDSPDTVDSPTTAGTE